MQQKTDIAVMAYSQAMELGSAQRNDLDELSALLEPKALRQSALVSLYSYKAHADPQLLRRGAINPLRTGHYVPGLITSLPWK